MGSTWQFNVIRELLKSVNINFTSCYWDGNSDPIDVFQDTKDVIVFKSHFLILN